MQINVDAKQGQRIRELVDEGMDPDQAYREVLNVRSNRASSTVEVAEKPKKKGHKFGAIPTTIDGIRFDSKKEAARYQVLKERERRGEIIDLVLQPSFDLHATSPEGDPVKIGKYVADFNYIVALTGEDVTEDVKGMKTPQYRWKRRHVEAEYGIQITET